MTFRPQRFSFDADEATLLRLKALSGKSYFQQKDFQQIVSALISKVYENNKGSKMK